MDLTKKENGQQLILSESMYGKISKVLDNLFANTRAEAIVFCDSNGYPVTNKGNLQGLDLPAIASLAANNYSATAKMASMLGETNSFKFLFHEGERTNMYLSNVGYNFILLIIFETKVALGMVRIFTKKAIDELGVLLTSAKDDEEKSKEFLDLEFKSILGEELDRAFKN